MTFRSAADILRTFDLPLDGPHYRRLGDGFKRLFSSTIYFGTDRAELRDYSRFHFFDRLKIWYTSDHAAENIIELREALWREIYEHPIPVDLTVVRALAGNPGAMDFYMWIVWRTFTARSESTIPLFGRFGLAAQLGVGDYTRERNFRKRVREWLRLVRL